MIEYGKKDEIILNPMHPYTIEILYDYLRFYENIEPFICPLINDCWQSNKDTIMVSDTHYVRSLDFMQKPINLNKIKEKIYENIRNEQHKYLL